MVSVSVRIRQGLLVDIGRHTCYNDSMSTKYTKEILQDAVNNSLSYAGVLRHLKLPQAGGTQAHIKRRIVSYEIDTSHFTGKGHNKGKASRNRRTPEEILIVRPEGSLRESVVRLRRALLESGVPYQCQCGLTDTWQDGILTLEIDHINGDPLDNRIGNLRFICPNCHSQQTQTSRSWKNTRGEKRIPLAIADEVRYVEPCECGTPKSRRAKTCVNCYKAGRNSKIDWPARDEVAKMVEETNYTKAGEALGVSDNAVRKFLRRTT